MSSKVKCPRCGTLLNNLHDKHFPPDQEFEWNATFKIPRRPRAAWLVLCE